MATKESIEQKELSEKLKIISDMLFETLKENVKLELRVENLEKAIKETRKKIIKKNEINE